MLSVVTHFASKVLIPRIFGAFCFLFHIGMIHTVIYAVMELLTYGTLWLTFCVGISTILFMASPYYNRNSKKSGLRVAYEITLHKAEQLEILKHKWFESERAGHDVGMKSAQDSWSKLHADKWRANKDKAA